MYCIYLRKSRADIEAESRGEEETLARHEKTLKELAKQKHLEISHIYKEVVSGETIASRPQMQMLLSDIEQKKWEGVLVMEVERLARGDTIDQGIVAQTFMYTNTLIITPTKTYDPANEYDQEYFEFGLFMSRREHKTIKRRMNAGRLMSVKEGKYVGSGSPYGYDRVKLSDGKGYTLKINEDEAKAVRFVFDSFLNGINGKSAGITTIARELNKLGYKPRKSKSWSISTVRDMLTNVHYAGKVRWNWRKEEIKIKDGIKVKSRPRNYRNNDIYDGLHEAIIDMETFEKVQKKLEEKKCRKERDITILKNPLAGIIICKKCGHVMVRKPYKPANTRTSMLCTTLDCDNVSAPLCLIEERLLQTIKHMYEEYKIKISADLPDLSFKQDGLKQLQGEYKTSEKQLEKAYELMEKEIYTIEEFTKRSKLLKDRLSELNNHIEDLKKEIESLSNIDYKEYANQLKNVIDLYDSADLKQKNELLKSILIKVDYYKQQNRRIPDNFTLTVYPRLK